VRVAATQIAAEVKAGSRSAVETITAALDETEACQPRLNIATFVDRDAALTRAAQIDEAVAVGVDPGPLAGVPVALKDLVDQAGRTTTCGSSFYRRVAERSATVVERLEASGAVIVSRTGLHEFAFGFSSENHWFGPVRNPLDPETSPGGSSGGSAAAVAAGQVPIGIGTDTGGSVRVPAALCGQFGLKVTHGRIPLTGVFPLAPSLDTVGPIASTVEDLTLAYSVLAGDDPADPWSAPRPVVTPSARLPDLQGVRIGIPVPWVDDVPTSEEVAVAFAETVGRLQALGAEVTEIEEPSLTPPGMIREASYGEVATIHRRWWSEGREYGPEVAARIDDAMTITLDEYVEARAWRSALTHVAARIFRRVDLLVTPATGVTTKRIGEDLVETSQGPVPYRTALSGFTALVNHLGCPALVAPTAYDAAPPPALQLVAPWWREHRLLEVAALGEREGVFTSVTVTGA